MAPADFRDYREELQTFAGHCRLCPRATCRLATVQPAEQLRGMQVSAGFFSCSARAGRSVASSKKTTRSGPERRAWSSAMGCGCGASTAIRELSDERVRLRAEVFRVVGVLPAGFQHVGGTYRTYGHGAPSMSGRSSRCRARTAARFASRITTTSWDASATVSSRARDGGGSRSAPARASRSAIRRRTVPGRRRPSL